jgi:hypothetical protein
MKNILIIELYDSRRTLVSADFESQVTLLRGDYRAVHRGRHQGATLQFELELTNGPLDNYVVHVAAPHHYEPGTIRSICVASVGRVVPLAVRSP